GRPIHAQAARAMERVFKWGRRRPALAALVGVSGASFLLLLSGSLFHSYRLGKSEADARRQADRADQNYHQARDAMNRMLGKTRADTRTDLVKLRRELQEEALAFFLTAADQQGHDASVRLDMAQASLEAGRLQIDLGRHEDAKVNLERARTRFT